MNATAIVTLLIAIFKAIPPLKKLWDGVVIEYVKTQKKRIVEENHEAVEEAIESQDQRGLEDEAHSGKPSGVGTIVTSLPGVHK